MRTQTAMSLLAAALLLALPLRSAEAPTPAEIKKALKDFRSALGPDWTPFYSSIGYVTSITGTPAAKAAGMPFKKVLPYILKKAAAFSGASVADFADPAVSELGAEHQNRYAQRYNGTAIEDAYIDINSGPAEIIRVLNRAIPSGQQLPGKVRSARDAERLACDALENDLGLHASCSNAAPDPSSSSLFQATATANPEEPTIIAVDTHPRQAYHVGISVVKKTDEGLIDVALREYVVDAGAAEGNKSLILKVLNLLHNGAFSHDRIFNPNPANAMNIRNPPFRPENVDESSYDDIELPDLHVECDGGVHLQNSMVSIEDFAIPHTAPPMRLANNGAIPLFACERTDEAFTAVMAYYHITRMQKYVGGDLGLPAARSMPVCVDVDAGGKSDVAASCAIVKGGASYIRAGHNHDGKIALAEDGDVLAHEYGHTILGHSTGDRFNLVRSATLPLCEAGAVTEGFADYWAMSTFSEETIKHGHRLDCLGEWVAEGGCVRTLTTQKTHVDYDSSKLDEDNGEIWSAVLFELFNIVGDKRIADYVILQGHLARASEGPAPTMAIMARGIMEVAAACNLAPDTLTQFLETFKEHHIDPASGCPDPVTGCMDPI
jgi:hypothetical protein